MTEEELIKNNKLIVDFMGFSKKFPNMKSSSKLSKLYYYGENDYVFPDNAYSTSCTIMQSYRTKTLKSVGEVNHLKCMQFHRSWDWIMPVIEKIENLGREKEEKDWELFTSEPRIYINSGYVDVKACIGTHENKLNKRFTYSDYKGWGGLVRMKNVFSTNTKLNCVYLIVIEFIKYYNKNKNE